MLSAISTGCVVALRRFGGNAPKFMWWLLAVILISTGFVPARTQNVALDAGSVPLSSNRPVQLAKLIIKLESGSPYGRVRAGLLCLPSGSLNWRTGRHELDVESFSDEFQDRMTNAGFDVVGGETDMFDEGETSRAEYLIGGTINAIAVDACASHWGLGDRMSVKGSADLSMEWYVYSRLDRKVVARFPTRGRFDRPRADLSGVSGLIVGAFGENLQQLIATGKLERWLKGPPSDPNVARVADPRFPPLHVALVRSGAIAIRDVAAATVLIVAGNGFGSGCLISKDGYFLTNHHVVGQAKYVKVRWPDGLESVGEVVRSDTGRDVALVKGDGRGRRPLPLAAGAPDPGATVFAVGAPLETRLQSTITRGIVSAERVRDGYRFIQSDVSVNHGNSGGPLVDEQGRLLGLTDIGLVERGIPLGLNFFIPIDEALAFLAITGP